MQKIIFPNRKDRQALSRIADDGMPFYWMVALSLSEGNLIDVKDAVRDVQKPYCVLAFILSDHNKYQTPYVLNENEVLPLKSITKYSNSTQNIYYFNFTPPEYRCTLRCFVPITQKLKLPDFEKIVDGVFKLQLD